MLPRAAEPRKGNDLDLLLVQRGHHSAARKNLLLAQSASDRTKGCRRNGMLGADARRLFPMGKRDWGGTVLVASLVALAGLFHNDAVPLILLSAGAVASTALVIWDVRSKRAKQTRHGGINAGQVWGTVVASASETGEASRTYGLVMRHTRTDGAVTTVTDFFSENLALQSLRDDSLDESKR